MTKTVLRADGTAEITLPDGRTVIVPCPTDAIARKPTGKKLQVNREADSFACAHLGGPAYVPSGCGARLDRATFHCDHPEHSLAAPFPGSFAAVGVQQCRLCKDFEKHQDPGKLRLLASKAAAVLKWEAANRPVRTQEEVNERLAICRACPFMMVGNYRGEFCGKCGCPVNDKLSHPTNNKLAMKTEICPLNPPAWT